MLSGSNGMIILDAASIQAWLLDDEITWGCLLGGTKNKDPV